MIARATPQSLHARDAAMDEYIDALLLPVDATPRPGHAAAPVAEPAVAVDAAIAPALATVLAADVAGSNRAVYRVCSVAGIQVAIPVGDIESWQPLDAHIIAVAQVPDWCLGVIEKEGRRCHVIDLARVIAPTLAERAVPVVAIALVGGHWMLACDGFGEEIVLASGEVRWRELAGDRPWLAGTALERRCAVLDVIGLSGLLSREMHHG